MTYRIKVIEYESGRKEYVPQVRCWFWWQSGSVNYTIENAEKEIEDHKKMIRRKKSYIIKSITYKTVQP